MIFSSNGFFAKSFVLKPNFSACARASSVVPVLVQFSLNFIKSGSSLKSFDIGWSTDRAKNEQPNNVSGLVVNILIVLNSLQFSKSKLISQKCNIIVFDRHGYKKNSLKSKTFKSLNNKTLTFVEFKKVNISSSQLRKI